MTDETTDINFKHIRQIASELKLGVHQVEATVELLDDGSTVPFIARYRKEATGSLDEVDITKIRDRLQQLRDLDKRREAILNSLEERELLTDELEQQINSAQTMAELEDIYLPYKPKRRTRATIAREKGLEPLAEAIFSQENIEINVEAEKYIDAEKGVESIDDALAGARDIVAEWVNEDTSARSRMRELFNEKARLKSKVSSGKEEEAIKYKDYFDWEEPINRIASHRVLAVMRGEKEGMLSYHVLPDEEEAVSILDGMFVDGDYDTSKQVRMAVRDSYKRLLGPSMETELRGELKKWADTEAIQVFTANLRQLLLASPLGQKNILALDPGFRTGCKVVCLDGQGNLLYNTAIYPHPPDFKVEESGEAIKALCERFKIEAIAIGNGTAGRETDAFVRKLGLPKDIIIVMVNESGASVYSASDVAREEFPDYDVTVRGAVSIGRRLMDPLSELVKIDPKSIGVGQYQHDVDQSALKGGLDDTVISCVNAVGVEINTASKQLLTYVSGLGPHLARKITEHREKKGPFKARSELMDISGFGPKAFEQAAGFLRIQDAENPLDKSAVHPESYHIVERMAKDLKCSLEDLMADENLRKRIDLKKYQTETVGMPTLQDIMDELAKPGRDPREKFEPFSFAENVNTVEDLKEGMKLPGIVTNITSFGVFVDIGVHQDGLVHKSQLADKYVENPADVVAVNQQVKVTVMSIDLERNRIALSMKTSPKKK
jgi:uncharacterized protein